MKKTAFIFLALARLGFSYSDSFEWHMSQYWLMFSCKAYEQANQYLSDLVNSEDIPNIDKIHYVYYRHIYYWKINNERLMSENLELLNSLVKSDPLCAEEYEKFHYNLLTNQESTKICPICRTR